MYYYLSFKTIFYIRVLPVVQVLCPVTHKKIHSKAIIWKIKIPSQKTRHLASKRKILTNLKVKL